MRPILFLLLLLGTLSTAAPLGRLVQPDGTSAALAEESTSDGYTLLFSPREVSVRSWLTLPRGSAVSEIDVVGPGSRSVITFPKMEVPGTRFAFEVSASVLAVTVKGKFGPSRTLVRTLQRPGNPGEAWVTQGRNDLRVDLPAWRTAQSYTPVLTLTRRSQSPWKASFTNGSVSRSFSFQASVFRWDFSPDAWGFTPTRFEVTGSDPGLAAVRVRALGPQADLPADPETLLAWPPQNWRDPRREWFSWTGTSVLVLVCSDYRVQDEYLKRLAFFVEKTGYRGRLVADYELAPLHGWNAHDYDAIDLARFFTQAKREGFPLNASEEELRDRLTAAGVLVARGGSWEPGTGALVGISHQAPPALRAVLFTHEAFHGLYFTSASFREGVASVWSGLSQGAQRAFRSFLALSQYDPDDEALMINEFQAYVLQRPATEWTPFFRDRVLGKEAKSPEGTRWLMEYLTAAKVLDALVDNLYGARAGTVSSVSTP